MKWVRAHRPIAIILCVSLLLCLIVTLSYVSKGSTTPVGRGIQRATAFIQTPIAGITHGIENGLTGIFRFKVVVNENQELKDENARLREEIIRLRLTEKDLQELRELANVFNYAGLDRNRQVIAAKVINWDGANWFNIFTINVGTKNSVYKDAVVINGDGLIGTVMETTDGCSKIISIIDETNKVSFKVLRDMDLLGIMQGDGKGGLTGFMLDNKAGVVEGDLLITSSIGSYPEGIPIGKVTSVNNNPDTQLKTITIETGVNFKNLQKVAVIL